MKEHQDELRRNEAAEEKPRKRDADETKRESDERKHERERETARTSEVVAFPEIEHARLSAQGFGTPDLVETAIHQVEIVDCFGSHHKIKALRERS